MLQRVGSTKPYLQGYHGGLSLFHCNAVRLTFYERMMRPEGGFLLIFESLINCLPFCLLYFLNPPPPLPSLLLWHLSFLNPFSVDKRKKERKFLATDYVIPEPTTPPNPQPEHHTTPRSITRHQIFATLEFSVPISAGRGATTGNGGNQSPHFPSNANR